MIILLMYVLFLGKNTMDKIYTLCFIFMSIVQSHKYTCPSICYCESVENIIDCGNNMLTALPEDLYIDVSVYCMKKILCTLTNNMTILEIH